MKGMSGGPDGTATRSLGPAAAPAEPERSYFLVVEGDASSMFHLPGEGVILVGRGDEADLRLRDPAASRRHARILVGDGEIRVADLESHNGTRVNGERVTGTRVLSSGDVVSIGEAALVLHRRARAAPSASVADPARLQARLEEEVERALSYDRPLALAAVATSPLRPEPAAVARATAAVLRRIDVAAFADDGQLLVLLPELAEDAALERIQDLLEAIEAAAPGSRAGVAVCPADGCDADALVEAARAAAAAAKPDQVLPAARAVTELTFGERAILVADPAMLRIFDLLRRLAASDLPVLVTGETGAGKENAAFAVHAWSPRREAAFVTLNCAALPENLVESELFGYEKGAFSGAVGPKPGLLETAHGGTAFLDEVGELAPGTQAKLLRALEAKRITRLGGVREREIDIRIVAATNRDLEADVRDGRFRQDLFFRLGAASVVLPPLRERPREVALLARSFLAAACTRAGRPPMRLSGRTMRVIGRYGWPGNVRELKNAVEYVAATALGDVAEPHHLPERLRPAGPAASPEPPPEAAPDAPRTFRPVAEELRDLEATRMLEALEAAGGVRKRAAELLGMPLRTFAFKFRQYGLAARLRDGR
jgi:DNA-binding NtrC family response regulator/pSer/pThr/pTyr-binding forkhead associated (FHA) protein